MEKSSWLKNPIVKTVLMLLFLWMFLISIKLFGGAFKSFFKADSQSLIENATGNPLVGFFIGILATAIIQSSSSTTSIIIAFVASGTLSMANAVPMVMGANIGTSVTNIIVSFGNIRNKVEFRRSFSAAIVHDFFNWMAVAIFLPLEIWTGFLSKVANYTTGLILGTDGVKFQSPIAYFVNPVAHEIEAFFGDLMGNIDSVGKVIYDGFFLGVMTVVSLAMLFVSLKYMSDIMKGLLIGRFEKILHKYIFSNQFLGFLLGVVFTVCVQSSSVTTSLIVPLVGAGILTTEQIFTYTVGANIGTTITGILAAMVTGNTVAISVALVHLFFNILGGIIFIPLKFLPIKAANKYADLAMSNRMYAIGLIVILFFVIPLTVIFFFS